MSLTLAEVLREHWPSYAEANRSRLSTAHYRAVDRVLACRTPALGGRVFQCDSCTKLHFAYHSCNHRSCPQCGALDQQKWTAKQEAALLPVYYFMVTFTVPSSLRATCLRHPKEVYGILLKESARALQDVIHTKTGADITASTSVLHTWGRQMQHHPHVHCIVPAVGLNSESGELCFPKKADDFLVHFSPIASRFRNRVRIALQQEYPDIYANLTPEGRSSLSKKTIWNVQLQAVGSGKSAVRYLARYVHRSAFTSSRLLGYDANGNVMLRWTCSTTKRQSVLHLHPHEFIRRWLIHVLPKGFARVRHYGFASSAAKRNRLRVRWLLGADLNPAVEAPKKEPFQCPGCGGQLRLIHTVEPIRAPRGPPAKS